MIDWPVFFQSATNCSMPLSVSGCLTSVLSTDGGAVARRAGRALPACPDASGPFTNARLGASAAGNAADTRRPLAHRHSDGWFDAPCGLRGGPRPGAAPRADPPRIAALGDSRGVLRPGLLRAHRLRARPPVAGRRSVGHPAGPSVGGERSGDSSGREPGRGTPAVERIWSGRGCSARPAGRGRVPRPGNGRALTRRLADVLAAPGSATCAPQPAGVTGSSSPSARHETDREEQGEDQSQPGGAAQDRIESTGIAVGANGPPEWHGHRDRRQRQ